MNVARHTRYVAPLVAVLVAGTLAGGPGCLARGEEILKIGAPVAATGPDAREGALTKDG